MQVLKLSNVGRKFQKFIDSGVVSGQRDSFKTLYSRIDGFWALRNIYMEIDKGEIVAVIGRNGSGKTTLLNIIAGTLPVSEGEIILRGRVSALLTLGAGFQDEFTGKENVYLHAALLGWKKQEIEKRFMDILDFSELGGFIDAPLGTYSAGMKMRLGFSIVVHSDFDILLTDEIIAVGDISFQKKCFEKMKEFKKQSKAMLIITQDLTLVERFCDRAYLLEDGRILFNGAAREAIERYQMLLSRKKILSEGCRLEMVKETKRWATDLPEWGKREGTKEIVIEKVALFNSWRKTNRFRPRDRMIVKVYFKVNDEIENFHFGVAIFREDGVYCYGPNTKFDGLSISRAGRGYGNFEFECRELLLMPGVYYLSVAVWDEHETFAYDYHRCSYKLEVVGDLFFGQLLCLTSKWESSGLKFRGKPDKHPNLGPFIDSWGSELKNDLVSLESVKCLDAYGGEDSVFVTGRDMKIKVDFKTDKSLRQELMLWVGIYRSDGIYCYGDMKKIISGDRNSEILTYPKLKLLAGGYRISIGIWGAEAERLLTYSHGVYAVNIISERRDHGTIYLEHRWNWKMPEGRKK